MPYILHLPDDIILDVFFLNANMFVEFDCLKTTISCTHVCTAWRSLILATPSIWGRLLGLGDLERLKAKPRQQILARTGNSPLWVYGMVRVDTEMRTFFIDEILNPHWDRIEHVSISIVRPSEKEFFPILRRPAPALRSFVFKAISGRVVLPFDSTTPLFSDDAPLLRMFSSDCISCNFKSPCMKYLQDLTFSRLFTIRDILTCLQSTVFLECLEVYMVKLSGSNTVTDDADALPTAILPRLITIQLIRIPGMKVADGMTLLKHIQPADGCSLIYDPEAYSILETHPLADNLKGAMPVLSSYLKRYIQKYHSLTHEVKIYLVMDTAIAFECYKGDTNSESQNDIFRVRFPTNTRAPGEDDVIISSFATLFSSCDFAAVTTLNLDMHRGWGPSSSTDEPGVLLSPSYLPYFTSFPSITHLSVHEGTLRIILALSEPIIDSQNHLFPLLQTLTIHAFEDNLAVSTSSGSGSVASRPLVPFLLHRRSIGLPVRTLVYYVSRYYQPVIRGLEDMIGLRVCRRGPGSEELKYVCGQA